MLFSFSSTIKLEESEINKIFSEAKKKIDKHHIRYGVFSEKNIRFSVSELTTPLKTKSNKFYRKTLRKIEANEDYITNSELIKSLNNIFNFNLLKDSLLYAYNKRVEKYIKLLIYSILKTGGTNDMIDIGLSNSFQAVFIQFLEMNVYMIKNSNKTIEKKGFDAFLRDTRQMQKSVTAKHVKKS